MRSRGDSEWVTRKQLVDKALVGAGWRVVPYADRPLASFEACAVEEFPTATGPGDYALVLDGRVVGIVEAKTLKLGPQNVLSQAERYARGLHSDGVSWGELVSRFCTRRMVR